MDEGGTDEEECSIKVASERRVVGTIRYLVKMVNARSVQLECARIMHESFLLPALTYVPNARIRQLCGVTKGVDENSDEDVLRWFGHVERMENDMMLKGSK